MIDECIENLTKANAQMHDCSVLHSETITVIERVGDETLFNANVEIFDFQDHPLANKALDQREKMTVRRFSILESSSSRRLAHQLEAVQAAIANGKF